MDWICYIFRKGKHIYLVSDDCIDGAWIQLANRQSCSIENCKKWYVYIEHMDICSKVKKI